MILWDAEAGLLVLMCTVALLGNHQGIVVLDILLDIAVPDSHHDDGSHQDIAVLGNLDIGLQDIVPQDKMGILGVEMDDCLVDVRLMDDCLVLP